ncbi:hypothetical protein GW17_00033280 [Ensete ventricosum]|nr:hypothetical protein GW17_00033280 [Ensete ventricosum]
MHGGKSVRTKEGFSFVTSPVLEGSFPTTLVSLPPATPMVQTLRRQCGVKDRKPIQVQHDQKVEAAIAKEQREED